MFERNELYKVYKISVPIIDMLVPYWNLYIRVGGVNIIDSIELPKEYSAVKDSCANAYAEYKQYVEKNVLNEYENFAAQESVSNQVLHILKDYIIESIYSKENFNNTFIDNVLSIIHKGDSLLCVTKGCDPKKMKSLLSKFLRKSNPIMLLLKAIDTKKGDRFDDMINKGIYDIEAENALESADIRCIYSPIYYKTDFCSPVDKYETYNLDVSEFWLNHNFFKEFQDEELKEADRIFCFTSKTKDSILNFDGICLNNLIIPLVSDFKELYPQNLTAIWRELKNGVYHHKSESLDSPNFKCNEEQKAFLELAKNEDVTNRLSYLTNNLFIPQEYISKIDGIESCFNDIMIVDGLSELENYEFFSSHNDNDKPFLGIHKKDKAGSSAYKLLHYIYKKDNKLNNIRGHNQINKCNGKIAKVLKPNLAFYYLLRYYEDFFTLALNEIRQENEKIDFIANQNLSINNSKYEVDVIAFNGTDIYIIELKTNLTIDYIVSYQKKCNNWLQYNPEIANHLKFMIVGNFGSETLNVCGNKEESNEYNVARPNMKGCAYSFSVPLDSNQELLCFTESCFEKLKFKLSKILIRDEAPNN